ncbi:hypothetical protein [Antrihabitans stalactiti]|uniref:Uncharacterized protein n=1 Tax=Antrihabitans stalactiti TaxID=2584121 RepID=A0A848KJ18_9NOCA|nr:hypothetical protein [Antrihabitans stalactiti]NMN97816.1 hypothetical protein [Antrihabitans stalactiti]
MKSAGLRNATSGILLLCLLIASLVACHRSDSPPGFDSGCLFREGDSALFYGVVVDRAADGQLQRFPSLEPYFGADGKLVPFADAIWIDNPLRDPRTGRDKVGAASLNYLRYNDFPTAAFGNAYYDIRNRTEQAKLDDAEVYFALAQSLELDKRLPQSDSATPYLTDSGTLKRYQDALGVNNPEGDPLIGSTNISRVFGNLFNSNGIPADALVDAYVQRYRECAA